MRLFYSGKKENLLHFSLKTFKKTSTKLKNIWYCRFAILEIRQSDMSEQPYIMGI